MSKQKVTVVSAAGTWVHALRHSWALAAIFQQAIHASSLRVDTASDKAGCSRDTWALQLGPPRHLPGTSQAQEAEANCIVVNAANDCVAFSRANPACNPRELLSLQHKCLLDSCSGRVSPHFYLQSAVKAASRHSTCRPEHCVAWMQPWHHEDVDAANLDTAIGVQEEPLADASSPESCWSCRAVPGPNVRPYCAKTPDELLRPGLP